MRNEKRFRLNNAEFLSEIPSFDGIDFFDLVNKINTALKEKGKMPYTEVQIRKRLKQLLEEGKVNKSPVYGSKGKIKILWTRI